MRMRLVIVRRRIGTPPTGSSVLGVSSECGRSRVAQPAARMTAFIELTRSCKAYARETFAVLRQKVSIFGQVALDPDNFLSPCRCDRNRVEGPVVAFDAVILAESALSSVRIAGLTVRDRAVRVAQK